MHASGQSTQFIGIKRYSISKGTKRKRQLLSMNSVQTRFNTSHSTILAFQYELLCQGMLVLEPYFFTAYG